MRRTLTGWLLLLSASLVPAQQDTPRPDDQLAAGKARLRAALGKTAALRDVAFEARWAEAKKAKGEAAPRMPAPRSGEVTGSWHAGLQHLRFAGAEGDELLVAGRRTLAKDDQNPWTLRAGRFRDGNQTDYLPDVELLLDQLADVDLAVVHREVGSLDDKPVEILTATLNPDQVAALAWAGALPPSLTVGAFAAFRMFGAGGAGPRAAAAPPTSTIDVAVTLDPATSLVQRLQFRAWTKQDEMGVMAAGGPAGVVVVRGGAVQFGAGGGDEDDEADDEAKEAAPGPMQFEGGLPVRSRKKTTVMDYTVRLTDHGTKAPPALTDAQRKLLRL